MIGLEHEQWRDIPGFDGRYQASTAGRIRHIWPKSKKIKILNPFIRGRAKKHSSRNAMRVHLSYPDGRRVERTVIKLVADTFFGDTSGKTAVHRNGVRSDNSVSNIQFLTNAELGKTFGSRANRRPVIKIDRDGEIVDCYSSARQAAKANHMSYQTVIDRCNQKIRKPFELDGHNYQWESKRGE